VRSSRVRQGAEVQGSSRALCTGTLLLGVLLSDTVGVVTVDHGVGSSAIRGA